MRPLLPLLILSACAGPAPDCPVGMVEARMISGFFGQTVADGSRQVTPAEWRAFREEVLTPLFPAGATVTDGRGTWRHRDGRMAEEDTKIVTVLAPAAEAAETLSRLREATQRYSAAHPQEEVGITLQALCVSGFFPAGPGGRRQRPPASRAGCRSGGSRPATSPPPMR